jgi:uncharacterized repeat protein (TIGR01451 family)
MPATEPAPSAPRHAVPCAAGDCSSAIQATCNITVAWTNDDIKQWDTYDCLDATIFPGGVTYSETLYTISIVTPSLDLSLAIPKAMTTAGDVMDNFGAILDRCDNDHCLAATHVKDLTIHQHAIVPNAPTKVYTLAIDSPNMKGFGDAIIACGSHNTGWCDDPGVVSETLACGNYSISGDTEEGLDNITHYDISLAFDGPEVTYKLVLTESRYFSTTLYYPGNLVMDYYNYMAFFLLGSTCDQRSSLRWGAQGESPMGVPNTDAGWLPPGTYYLVVDGSHMPARGDAFDLDIGCAGVEIAKTAADLNGGPLYSGDEIEYTVTLRNTGGIALPALKVQDDIPDRTTYVPGSAQGTPDAGITGPSPLAATWGNVAAGKTVTLTFRVTLDEAAIGTTVANTVTASAYGLPSLGHKTALIGPVRAPIQIGKRVTSESKGGVKAGDRITYTITLTNPDTVAVSGFTLTDTLSPYVTYTVGSAVPAPTRVAGKDLVWSDQNIGPGAKLTYEFAVTVGTIPQGKVLENVAWLVQPGRDPVKTTVTGPQRLGGAVYLPLILRNH